MKKVVSSEEMQGLDKRTINEYNISSLKLMENAGLTVYEFLMNEYRDLKEKKVLIISGTGNNGADGLVIARHLKKSGISVCIYVINPEKNEGSPEFKENYEKIKKDVKVSFYYGNEKDIDDFINEIDKSDIIIDAIFGTGLSRDMDEKYIKIIQIVNSSNLKKISVDIPSGLDANTGFERPVSVISDNTVTFGLPKKGFYINSGPKSTGDLIVKNIGFPEKVIKEINAGIYLIEEEDVTCLLPERKKDSHKGNTGRLLIVGGSEGLSGALILSAKAALRTGAGMVYLAYPEKIGIQIETSVI